jgi:hypothetical protein
MSYGQWSPSKRKNMIKIISHDGKGHQDDFLATCVCIYKLNAPAYRIKVTEENLKSADDWVLDQGRKFEPEMHNFDHHQIEEEICAFTMVLDYFYGENYRDLMPQLRFIEIFDSYGPKKAAEFIEIKEENLDVIASPIYISIIRLFSKIEGEIKEPFYSIMLEIGRDICVKIEDTVNLLSCLKDSKYFEIFGIKVLDTTNCTPPDGYKHDSLPTKLYSKNNDLEPEVILTKDTRQNGYRMVSINTDSLKFLPNEKSYFTHNSGFLTGFLNYEDYKEILSSVLRKL